MATVYVLQDPDCARAMLRSNARAMRFGVVDEMARQPAWHCFAYFPEARSNDPHNAVFCDRQGRKMV